jgi:peroxiredoxin family protein
VIEISKKATTIAIVNQKGDIGKATPLFVRSAKINTAGKSLPVFYRGGLGE